MITRARVEDAIAYASASIPNENDCRFGDASPIRIPDEERRGVRNAIEGLVASSVDLACADVIEWQRSTFPVEAREDALAMARKLSEECLELCEAVALERSLCDVAAELADVLIVAIGLADGQGIDLASEIRAKLEINKRRRYVRSEDGTYSHER